MSYEIRRQNIKEVRKKVSKMSYDQNAEPTLHPGFHILKSNNKSTVSSTSSYHNYHDRINMRQITSKYVKQTWQYLECGVEICLNK